MSWVVALSTIPIANVAGLIYNDYGIELVLGMAIVGTLQLLIANIVWALDWSRSEEVSVQGGTAV